MQIVDNAIILILICLAFIAGKKMSDNYHNVTIDELRYQLRLLSAQHGTGYVAPPVRKQRVAIGQEFMDRLKEHGRATQQISPSKTP